MSEITEPPAVAVIDVGSNSIKLLVARRGADGAIVAVAERTEDSRIGSGIAESPPRLKSEAMARAVATVQALLAEAEQFQPGVVRMVATSAVRDAVNGDEFVRRVHLATGRELHVLTGAEEALLVGKGVAGDPALRGVAEFYLFDLGGGSLELLTVANQRVCQVASIPLGCVRVTELCVADAARAFTSAEIARIRAHARAGITGGGYRFNLATPAAAVATGGTVTTLRAIRAAATTTDIFATDAVVAIAELDALGERLAALPIDERRALRGLPAARADVFPAALLTLAEAARIAGVERLHHSFHNLRYGLATELLEGLSQR